MSANRDNTTKVTFIYSNLYGIYRKGKEEAQKAEVPAAPAQAPAVTPGLTTAKVIKPLAIHRSGVVTQAQPSAAPKVVTVPEAAAPKISEYKPAELLGKRIETNRERIIVDKPEYLKEARTAQTEALGSLKENLKTLNDLHSRLQFMLKELEDLVKE
jgi:hypothetical protein